MVDVERFLFNSMLDAITMLVEEERFCKDAYNLSFHVIPAIPAGFTRAGICACPEILRFSVGTIHELLLQVYFPYSSFRLRPNKSCTAARQGLSS